MCIQKGSFEVLNEKVMLGHGKSEEILKELEDNSVDSIVTDPPYGLGFMGKSWDKTLPPIEVWKECIRVLKPGGYLVAMSSSRTYHRLAVQLEDLGMICHPMIGWIYGSGFPKATDLSKQFDKQAGAERNIVGINSSSRPNSKLKGQQGFDGQLGTNQGAGIQNITSPSTNLAKKWNGYKYGLQSLKPALEPIAVFQKPWKCKDAKRMTDNIIKHGVGAFNIDECRVNVAESEKESFSKEWDRDQSNANGKDIYKNGMKDIDLSNHKPTGRHPANLLHDGSDNIEKHFPYTKGPGNLKPVESKESENNCMTGKNYERTCNLQRFHGQEGNASRFFNKLPITELDVPFFYTAKASKSERNKGVEEILVWENVDLNLLMERLKEHLKDISEDGMRKVKDLDLTTGLCGQKKMAQFQKDMISTMSTLFQMIIELKISHCLQKQTTREFTQDVLKIIRDHGESLVENVEFLKTLMQITTKESLALVLGVNLAVLKTLLKIKEKGKTGNVHSTVKPIKLMEWLIKLVTPKGGITVDPFAGSGTTGVAAALNDFRFIGIEETEEYLNIAINRIQHHISE